MLEDQSVPEDACECEWSEDTFPLRREHRIPHDVRADIASFLHVCGRSYNCSTFVDEVTITRGYGQLDEFGSWEFPLYLPILALAEAREAIRSLSESIDQDVQRMMRRQQSLEDGTLPAQSDKQENASCENASLSN